MPQPMRQGTSQARSRRLTSRPRASQAEVLSASAPSPVSTLTATEWPQKAQVP